MARGGKGGTDDAAAEKVHGDTTKRRRTQVGTFAKDEEGEKEGGRREWGRSWLANWRTRRESLHLLAFSLPSCSLLPPRFPHTHHLAFTFAHSSPPLPSASPFPRLRSPFTHEGGGGENLLKGPSQDFSSAALLSLPPPPPLHTLTSHSRKSQERRFKRGGVEEGGRGHRNVSHLFCVPGTRRFLAAWMGNPNDPG